jgi:hypothetical protein
MNCGKVNISEVGENLGRETSPTKAKAGGERKRRLDGMLVLLPRSLTTTLLFPDSASLKD